MYVHVRSGEGWRIRVARYWLGETGSPNLKTALGGRRQAGRSWK